MSEDRPASNERVVPNMRAVAQQMAKRWVFTIYANPVIEAETSSDQDTDLPLA